MTESKKTFRKPSYLHELLYTSISKTHSIQCFSSQKILKCFSSCKCWGMTSVHAGGPPALRKAAAVHSRNTELSRGFHQIEIFRAEPNLYVAGNKKKPFQYLVYSLNAYFLYFVLIILALPSAENKGQTLCGCKSEEDLWSQLSYTYYTHINIKWESTPRGWITVPLASSLFLCSKHYTQPMLQESWERQNGFTQLEFGQHITLNKPTSRKSAKKQFLLTTNVHSLSLAAYPHTKCCHVPTNILSSKTIKDRAQFLKPLCPLFIALCSFSHFSHLMTTLKPFSSLQLAGGASVKIEQLYDDK